MPYTVEYKFDGLTMCLTYENGVFVRATTRGNGAVGEDVTAQVLTIKSYPLSISYKGTLEVKGEAVIRLSVLDAYNKTAAEPLKKRAQCRGGRHPQPRPRRHRRAPPRNLFLRRELHVRRVARLAAGGGGVFAARGVQNVPLPARLLVAR